MFEIMPIFILAIWAVVIVAIIAGVIKGNKAKKKREAAKPLEKKYSYPNINNSISLLNYRFQI
jgi:tellurite resistance protein TehA-like permease